MPSDPRMDPNPPPSLKRKDRDSPPPPSQPSSSSTSLPSFRSLYLPPPPHQQSYPDERYYHPAHQPPPPSTASHPPAGPGPSGVTATAHRFVPHPESLGAPDPYGGQAGDSDQDGDGDQSGRPKQKRRRQALSCTECKRRKIKCDRAHPCGPCSRRGDQLKCQWHVIEPVDKYVSRAEYDELKARFDRLETLVGRMQVVISGASPGYGPPSAPDPRTAFPPAPFPSQPGSLQRRTEPGPSYTAPEPYRASPPSPVARPAYASSSYMHRQPPPHPPSPPAPLPAAESVGRSPSGPSSTAKPSPLSLSAITAPYNVSPHSKNYQAQTFTTLGERLRPLVVPQGPAAHTSPNHHPPPSPPARRLPQNIRRALPPNSIRHRAARALRV
ncbi:hypothetical protein K488DRAFT_72383 [Vararia minispora EC-137]|uniref:Uncharacterized protein n=1 Tax=Vararia minispora EC-137 TaxID=1314806 RepID=A0ACB8QEV0_9AGAM|nr:hypothetical protein K488DRAFT_72383 [Vararia minispora EC-137]